MSYYLGKVRTSWRAAAGLQLPRGRFKLFVDSRRLLFVGRSSQQDVWLLLFFVGLVATMAIGFMPLFGARLSWLAVAIQFVCLAGGLACLFIWLAANRRDKGIARSFPLAAIRQWIEPRHVGEPLELHFDDKVLLLALDASQTAKLLSAVKRRG
ncbi:MAG: hypothetical protein JXR96_22020 [Deltaproteobacteria bacterium]|nr:hypothetical protein [Deltaproteobacteria bacterium]